MKITDPDLERLREALTASGDLAYEWDLDSDRIVWLHEAAARHDNAYLTQATAGNAFNELVYPEDLPYRLEAIAGLLRAATSGVSLHDVRRGVFPHALD